MLRPRPSTAGSGAWRPAPRREDAEVRGSHLGLAHDPAVLWLLADRLAQAEGGWSPRPPVALRALFPPQA